MTSFAFRKGVKRFHEEFRGATDVTPFRDPFTGSRGLVAMPSEGSGVVWSVKTPKKNRNKGGADRVMSQVTEHLDTHKRPGILVAMPDDDTSRDGLRRLYHKHGFEGRGDILQRRTKDD